MCGIFGIWKTGGNPLDISAVCHGTSNLQHRGPDDEGYLLVNTQTNRLIPCGGADTSSDLNLPPLELHRNEVFDLALGFRRLAILDLSPAGHQPMANADGRLWIVFNGEIYNYIELREELKALGYIFKSGSDTEVILAAYEAWGVDCLNRFNGMFAFAIWDARQRKLFCARDRFGIKPLYYIHDGQSFLFASEIKALVQTGLYTSKPDAAIVYDYLIGRSQEYTADTFFTGIKKLLPAHYLILDDTGRLTTERWWQIEVQPNPAPSAHEADQVEQFLWLLRDSIRLHLRSDVPIGTCLSGGLDSSTIVCLANELMFGPQSRSFTIVGERQKTFSACYSDRTIDERPFIDLVVAKTNVDAHYVTPDIESLWTELERLVWHQDEPFLSTSIYAQWNVMRLASQNQVTVLLDGQGADELLGGYGPYIATAIAESIRQQKWFEAIATAREGQLDDHKWPALLGQGLFVAAPFRTQLWLRQVKDRFTSNLMEEILPSNFAQGWSARKQVLQTDSRRRSRTLAEKLYYDVTIFSLPHLLRYEDRNSMAFSLESRVPFLDSRLVEFAFSLPNCMKIREGWTKWILREATAKVLPEEIRWRRDKKGFPTPELQWLRKSRNRIRDLFGDSQVMSQEFIDTKLFLASLDRLLAAGATNDIWHVINLEMWLRAFWGNSTGRV